MSPTQPALFGGTLPSRNFSRLVEEMASFLRFGSDNEAGNGNPVATARVPRNPIGPSTVTTRESPQIPKPFWQC